VSVVRATHHYFLHINNLEFAFVRKTSQKRPFWSGLIRLSNLIEHLEAHQFAKNISMTSNRKNKRMTKPFYFDRIDRIVEKWIKCLVRFVPFWGKYFSWLQTYTESHKRDRWWIESIQNWIHNFNIRWKVELHNYIIHQGVSYVFCLSLCLFLSSSFHAVEPT
jgi:hypothetical protein